MESTSNGMAGLIFLIVLVGTFFVALLGRRHTGKGEMEQELAGRRLNKWLVGLSAGATGNSGFVVTGAVGLGYIGGVQWLLLPLSWLLGDLIFWHFFPDRLNHLARRARAVTISELLTFDLKGRSASLVSVIVALLLVVFLTTYTSAQWLAGRKFLSGAFEFTDLTALLFFSITIVAYSALGGFRGSVYADSLQAIIRLLGTVVATVAVSLMVAGDFPQFNQNIMEAGPGFLSLFPEGGWALVLGFIGGYAGAAIGFGLGQPQIISRYFAGSSPEETKSARWIYIGFLQFTWISMTLFGVALRGVMPGIGDPETGLSLFFSSNFGALVVGIIFADIYATIASTSNSLLIAISQTVRRDLLRLLPGKEIFSHRYALFLMPVLVGLVSVVLSFILPGNVFTIAIGAVSKIGAGVAGPVMIKVMGWKHTGRSLLAATLSGISAAFLWEYLGYSSTVNEAGVGIVVSLAINRWVAASGAPGGT